VVHADTIGHAVLEPEGEAFHAVSAWWPEILVDGHIDRSRLARIVFEDPQALRQLESMTHPAIAARILNLVAAEENAEVVVVELPLLLSLLGEGWTRVVVDAPVELRRHRLAERGMAAEDVEARMSAQTTREEWKAAAEFVIDNGGTLEDLESEVDRLLEWIKKG
jgi:dephospho-CoA kinase